MSYPAKEIIKKRKSVRTFDGRPLSAEHLKALEAHIDSQENPFGVPVVFRLLDTKEHGLSSPVILGEEKYLAAIVSGDKMQKHPNTRKEYFLNEIVNSGQTNKTYILEPTELEFDNDSYATISPAVLSAEILSNLVVDETFMQIGEYVLTLKNIPVDDTDEKAFTYNNDTYAYVSYSEHHGDITNIVSVYPMTMGVAPSITVANGTYTVSIYTETGGAQPVQPKEAFEESGQDQEADRP
jgi:hypothetical protein